MRVALFGGTFDPPHRGHVAIARAAADHFGLDRVFFAPAGRQPLKPGGARASYADRLLMTAIVCGEDTRFAVCNLDAPRADGEANYTVRTLGLLGEVMPGATLFSIVGADSFAGLAAWREPTRLLDMAEWIVVSRPGADLGWPAGLSLDERQKSRVHFLGGVAEDVSATELRKGLRAGNGSDGLLSPGVAAYIAEHGLYRGQAAP